MRKLLCLIALGALAAGALEARTLDLPIGRPGEAGFAAPGYWSNRLEIRLGATAAREARDPRRAR